MKKLLTYIATMTVVFGLSACGGGSGGGSNTSTPTSQQQTNDNPAIESQDFAPNGELLLSSALESNQLYVEEGFDFGSSDLVRLYITATDVDSQPLVMTRVSIYLVPNTLTEWHDEEMMTANLIASGVTNTSGVFERSIDVPNNGSQFLVVLHTLGIENKVLLAISSDVVNYHFQ